MTAELIVVGADVETMDPDQPHATAVAVADGQFVAVGDDTDVLAHRTATTEVINGAGWTVTPGLTDGHQHLFYGASVEKGVSFDRVDSLDEVRARISAEVATLGPNDWVRGYGLEYAAFAGHSFHHDLLDEITAGRPALIWALDLHTGFANAEALKRAGVTGPREFSDASHVVCDDDGAPTGELREFSAVRVVLDAIPQPTGDETLARAVETMRQQNALGITGIHQMDGDPETLESFAALEEMGQLTLSVAIHNVLQPDTDAEYIADLLGQRPASGQRWRSDGIKFWLDGVIETGTAWIEGAEGGAPGAASLWPSIDYYAGLVRQFDDAGFRIATHAIGDRAVREALDVYASLPTSQHRHRIEHIETAPTQTLTRFAAQGITASMQPIHLRWMRADQTDPWSAQLTHEQCDQTMPTGDLSGSGALVVLGSDWPVAPFDPRLGFFAAQLRRSPDADDPAPIGSSRPLTGHETLAGYTVNPARAVGEANLSGMVRPGMRADLAAWDGNPSRCRPQDILDLPVRLTVSAGQVVHRG